MADEPESRNEISGDVSGQAVQVGHIAGDMHIHVSPPAVPAKPAVPPRDRWLIWSGIATIVLGIATFLALTGSLDRPPLFGTGVVVDRDQLSESRLYAERHMSQLAGYWFVVWHVWTGWVLVTRRWQALGRELHIAQIALWLSLIPVYVGLGAPFSWALLFLLAAGLAVFSLVRGPRVLLPQRWPYAVLAGLVAALTWAPVEVLTLWHTPAPVVWRVAGMLLFLPIVAVPVWAVLTFPGDGAPRVLRSWAFCLAAKFAVTLLILALNSWLVTSRLTAITLPVFGVLGMLGVARILTKQVSAADA
jgi:hypothetical protein